LTNTLSLNLSNYDVPALRFNNAYSMTANDKGYLEISTNGVTWTPVVTYTGSTPHWSTEVIDLNNWSGASNVKFRFRANSATKLLWYVDDVYLNAWPAVTGAAFTYSPQPVRVQAATTFTASYTSIDTTLPITYTWDWGDGTPIQVTHVPTITHQFLDTSDYIVALTVENPYDSASTSQIVPVSPAADLSIVKSDSPDPVVTGHSLTYQITVTNHGPSMATDVIVTDALPPGLTLPSATPSQGNCNIASDITCDLGSLANGAEATITIVANVAPSATRTLTNTATVAGNEYDDYTTNNAATTATTVYHVPDAVDDTAETLEDTPITIPVLANDIDPDADVLLVTGVGSAGHGTVTTNGATVAYTPTLNFNGTDTFTYTISDGFGGADAATVTVTVTAINDVPTISDIADQSTNEDTPTSAIPFTVNDVETPASSLTLSAASSNPVLVPVANIVFGGSGSNRTVTITPATDQFGSAVITVTVSDGSGGNTGDAFTLMVASANDAPQFTSAPVTAATQDVAYTYNIAAADADAGDVLVITSPTKPAWLTLTDHGNRTATLSGTPTNADVGQHAVTLLVRDTGGLTAIQPFIIAVANVNDAPQFTSEPVLVVMQGALYIYNVIVTDIDAGDTVTITAPTLPGWLTFTDHHNGTATLSGTPTNDNVGQHAVTLQARDSAGAIATQSFAIKVKNVNDAPTAVNDSYNTNEDTPLVASGVLGNDTDPDDDPLRAILISTTSHGTLMLDTDGSFVYTPTANYNGADSFTYRANDYIADSNVATVSITVNPVNDAPVAVDDEYRVVKNEVLSVNVPGVLSNDSDVEHSPLSAILVSGPAHGTLTLNVNGSFTYTPDTDYVGSDSFTYQANDGTTSGNIATVTISILAEAPRFYIYLPVITR
jgi:uncharacterized repeat protein (TIGR01451 family)